MTRRSSSEWYERTARRPPGRTSAAAAERTASSSSSSPLTAMRSAWKTRAAILLAQVELRAGRRRRLERGGEVGGRAERPRSRRSPARSAGSRVLAVLPIGVGDLLRRPLVEDRRGGERAAARRLVHPHVERAVAHEREAALRRVELVRRDAEVEEQPVERRRRRFGGGDVVVAERAQRGPQPVGKESRSWRGRSGARRRRRSARAASTPRAARRGRGRARWPARRAAPAPRAAPPSGRRRRAMPSRASAPAGSVTKYLIVASQSTGAWYEVLCWARIGAWRAPGRKAGRGQQPHHAASMAAQRCMFLCAATSSWQSAAPITRQVCGQALLRRAVNAMLRAHSSLATRTACAASRSSCARWLRHLRPAAKRHDAGTRPRGCWHFVAPTTSPRSATTYSRFCVYKDGLHRLDGVGHPSGVRDAAQPHRRRPARSSSSSAPSFSSAACARARPQRRWCTTSVRRPTGR